MLGARPAGPSFCIRTAETRNLCPCWPCIVRDRKWYPTAKGADRTAHMPIPCIHRPACEAVSASSVPRLEGRGAYALACQPSKCPTAIPSDDLRVVVLVVVAVVLPVLRAFEVVRPT